MTPFVDVAEKSFTVETPQGQGNTTFNSVGIGTGSKVFRADSSGIWLGAAEFANAPFRVDMDGNATATSLTITGYVQEVGGNYTSASGTGARVQLLPDANTGFVAYDSSNTKVFEILVGGSNVGDVTIGNYGGGNGMFWDDSASKFTIKGDMTAGNISGVAITGSSISTGTTGNRVTMDSNDDVIKFYDSSNDVGMTLDLISSTQGVLYTSDSRELVLYSATGTVKFNNNNLGGLGNISTSGTISAGTFSGTLSGSVTGGTGSFTSISMSGNIDMNGRDITEIDELRFNTTSSNYNNSSWEIWAYNSTEKGFRCRVNGSLYQFDLTSK